MTNTAYKEAKAEQARLEERLRGLTSTLNALSGEKGPMGLTPDHVKAQPEWKAAKREVDQAFAALRNFNGAFVKLFKKEALAERRMKYAYSK